MATYGMLKIKYTKAHFAEKCIDNEPIFSI